MRVKRESKESTMIEEKRGLMGINRFLSREKVCKSWIGTSNSKTATMVSDKTELFKYCPLGLTGANISS